MVTKEFIKLHRNYLATTFKNKSNKLTTEDIDDLIQDTLEKVTLYQDYYLNEFDTQEKIPGHKRLKTWLKFLSVQVYDRFKRGSLQIDEIVKDYTKDDMLIESSNYFYTANKEEVDGFINMLPESQSTVVYMKLVLGYSHDEVSKNLYTSVAACTSNFKRGMDNLKKLINSDDPEKEVLQETKILQPHGDKPYAGDWAWRYGENEDRRNGKPRVYTNEEIIAYCNLNNMNYNLKERL